MTLSVCITHYNRPDRLAATLESLARQTRVPDEVLLWDDHSPRDPTEVATRFVHRFPRFVYHRNPTNLGMPGNLNAVLASATGDLVANLHDADEFHPTLLEKWEGVLQRHPSAGLAFCGLDGASKGGAGGRVWLHGFPPLTAGRDFFQAAYVGSASSPIWGTVMVRREVYRRHLPFDRQFRMWSDVDMWMRICGTHDIAYVPEPLIILDHAPTKFRDFTWEKFLITHRMPVVNIHRLAGSEGERAAWLARQRRRTCRAYVRHLLGRLVRGEIRQLGAGLSHWRDAVVRMPKAGWQVSPEGVRLVQASTGRASA